MPSPPSAGGCPSLSEKRVQSYLEGRSAGVGAFHVIPIPDADESNNNNNDSQVEPLETATVENIDSEAIESQPEQGSRRCKWFDRKKGSWGLCIIFLATVLSSLLIAFRRSSKSVDDMADIGIDAQPCIDTDRIKRTDRYLDFKSALEFMNVTEFDEPCGRSTRAIALAWLADADSFESSDASNADLYQRYAMVLFYVSTNMNSTIVAVHAGKVENPWLTDDPVCLWTGITCSSSPEDNTVTGIELSDLDLYGTIPNELFILVPHLKTLNVFENRLTGTIPVTLYSSLSLVNLNMGSNRLSGSMDEVEWSTNNMKKLNLANNAFSGSIPGSIGSLTNLVELDLSYNDFTGSMSSEMFNLPYLYVLNLSYNVLSGSLPSTLTTSLEYLNLGRNIVGGQLPVALYKLTNLVTFSLEFNDISGTLSQMLGNLHNLEELLLTENQITGMVPNTISKLSNLKILDLSSNIFRRSIPSEIGMLTNLLIIEMNGNILEGSIPSEIGQLTRLQELILSYNDLTQDIPIEFGMLSDLHTLWVAGLSISTQVPAEVCKLREENLFDFRIDCAPQETSSNENILRCDCCTKCIL